MGNVTPITAARPKVLEFFAGIGLARIGLEAAGFRVVWSNDYEPAKKAMYDTQFGETVDHTFTLGDIGVVDAGSLPVDASLAWASSPCTDLSLAGGRAGLGGRQSGTFWHFVRILDELQKNRPEVVVLENVVGLATSHSGDDLTAAITAFNRLGYSIDVLSIDARRFLPQSRPRLFLVGALHPPADDVEPGCDLRPDWLQWVFDDRSLRTHCASLPALPAPLLEGFGNVVEDLAMSDERWWDRARVHAFMASLSPVQADRVEVLKRSRKVAFRTAYRRTRNGFAVWEVRPDDISGCLRTARGGSSKQAVVRLGNNRVQVRWMTPREYAVLMGAGDYNLSDARNNQAFYGFGDAVAVPVVSWVAENYLMPLVRGRFGSMSHSEKVVANGE